MKDLLRTCCNVFKVENKVFNVWNLVVSNVSVLVSQLGVYHTYYLSVPNLFQIVFEKLKVHIIVVIIIKTIIFLTQLATVLRRLCGLSFNASNNSMKWVVMAHFSESQNQDVLEISLYPSLSLCSVRKQNVQASRYI